MKIVLAIDSFKGCLTSVEAERAAAEGVLAVCPDADVLLLPVSDGGEGMLHAFTAALGGTIVEAPATDPLGKPITARYGITPDGSTAIVEMAQASGLTLVPPEQRDPIAASTYGTGMLIAHAIERGCRRIIVGLGGSATTDGGRGMAEALGISVVGNNLDDSHFLMKRHKVEIIVASDVKNPLYGPEGAAHIFGPQKGASPRQVALLDERLRHWAELVARHVGRDYSCEAGAGAAGGLGFALMALCGARMHSGIDLLLSLVDFDRILDDAHLVITGEGSADRQTLYGKLPAGILNHAQRQAVPVALIAGKIDNREELLQAGFDSVVCINPPAMPLDSCLRPDVARANIAATVERIISFPTT